MKTYSYYFAFLSAIAIGTLAGCHSEEGPPLGKVWGTVRAAGAPVAGVIVVFEPNDGSRPSAARTSDDGTYELRYSTSRMGAALGTHTVRIMPDTDDENPRDAVRVPPEYNSKSTLKEDVVEGTNVIDFDISLDSSSSRRGRRATTDQ